MLKRLLIPFALALVLTIILQTFNINDVATYIIVFIVIFAILYLPVVYLSFYSTNIDAIDQFLADRKKHPQYGLYYGLANDDRELVEESMEKVLKRYKQPGAQAMFKVIFALYNKDAIEARKHVGLIKQQEYKKYYEAGIAIEEKDYEEARNIGNTLQKEWMKEAVVAEAEKGEGNLEQAKVHARKALAGSKGLQRYMLYKIFSREFTNIE
jgi:NOL1/NOP2/fmu family ribosome biogenesis protein